LDSNREQGEESITQPRSAFGLEGELERAVSGHLSLESNGIEKVLDTSGTSQLTMTTVTYIFSSHEVSNTTFAQHYSEANTQKLCRSGRVRLFGLGIASRTLHGRLDEGPVRAAVAAKISPQHGFWRVLSTAKCSNSVRPALSPISILP
jgi:hypothetical protein